ncbi:DUF294 nucleotidyltransferase-like domain-containing protein [Alkalicoccobacillus murimartini]|uniref:CBS domain-containing protein n=1 Tax=Alkalicoccobacillus murimartini TaxID=171685 RepID=A0ABT9YGW7_9BACI|nr:DUF294 nucleotidyltransferase-like domain-containing protein [Alkalicoccobacillus murimartini]MDQ0207113.1 CBS domain-containing protein [Alkalicoccobacillus murimartini]
MSGLPSHNQEKKWQSRLDELYKKRLSDMAEHELTIESVHELHEKLMKDTIQIAIEKTESEQGRVPAHFTFFVMGSAGRSEQLFWSDQDHGIIYEQKEEANTEELQSYFLTFGETIVESLEAVGYERCDGNVMASNKKWCKSREDFAEQLNRWLKEDTWENLRYLLTFFDGRVVLGPEEYLADLKQVIFDEIEQNPVLLERFKDNTGRLRNGIGMFGQLLTEETGTYKGTFDLKQLAMFPYVNGMRLLAIQEELQTPETLERFRQLPETIDSIKKYEPSYRKLLEKRLIWQKSIDNYDHIHYLKVSELDSDEKKRLKQWVKEGRELYHKVEKIVGRE